MRIILNGNPIPQQRPRFAKYSKHIYDPQADLKKKLFPQLLPQIPKELFDDFIFLQMIFYMPFQKSVSKKFIEENFHLPHIKRPDIDNLIKFYLDLMIGFVYTDDCTVAKISAQKVYSNNPRTLIIINPMGGEMITEHILEYETLSIEDI